MAPISSAAWTQACSPSVLLLLSRVKRLKARGRGVSMASSILKVCRFTVHTRMQPTLIPGFKKVHLQALHLQDPCGWSAKRCKPCVFTNKSVSLCFHHDIHQVVLLFLLDMLASSFQPFPPFHTLSLNCPSLPIHLLAPHSILAELYTVHLFPARLTSLLMPCSALLPACLSCLYLCLIFFYLGLPACFSWDKFAIVCLITWFWSCLPDSELLLFSLARINPADADPANSGLLSQASFIKQYQK